MNKLGFKGVTFYYGKYNAFIKVKGKVIHLGRFDKIGYAAFAYNRAVKRLRLKRKINDLTGVEH